MVELKRSKIDFVESFLRLASVNSGTAESKTLRILSSIDIMDGLEEGTV